MAKKEIEPITSLEIEAILAVSGRGATGIRNRAAIVMMWRAGLRAGEISSLSPRDWDGRAKAVSVRENRLSSPPPSVHRVVTLDSQAAEAVEAWIAARLRCTKIASGSPYLFCTLRGGPVQSRFWWTVLSRMARRAGIAKRVYPDALRRLFASNLLQVGATLRQIQIALGHASLSTTVAYLSRSALDDEFGAANAQRQLWLVGVPDEKRQAPPAHELVLGDDGGHDGICDVSGDD